MTDVRLEREFGVTPEKLFRFISGAKELVQWFGPEGLDEVVRVLAPGGLAVVAVRDAHFDAERFGDRIEALRR